MSSASTHRRARRNASLMLKWANTPPGQRVTVRRANGTTLKTITTTAPYITDNGGAYIVVEGIPGNTALHRVTKGWNPTGGEG